MRRTALFSALILAAICGNAFGASFTIGGPSAEATVRTDNTRVLYASDRHGSVVLITEIGAGAPGGGKFTELGVPSMSADGRVLFGAEVLGNERHPHWDIFEGTPERPLRDRVRRVLNTPLSGTDCLPQFKGDPYPVSDSAGVAFSAPVVGGGDALFIYSGDRLNCVARTGDNTKNGHTISVLGFGTVQTAQPGQLVFNAFLKGERQALLAASKSTQIEELAVEGEVGPGRATYGHGFGLPAALGTPDGPIVAFTDKTSSGTALYLYRGGKMARIFPSGTLTPLGPVTYLSPGRPGLAADGTTAVLAGCARVPAIFKLVQGRLDLSLRRGQMSPLGAPLVSLGDPALTAGGTMLLGAIDTDDREKLYKLSGDNGLSEVGISSTGVLYNIAYDPSTQSDRTHSIFTGTLTVNQRGDFAYLGGQ